MEEKKIVKFGNVELYEDDAVRYAQERRCIVSGKSIIQLAIRNGKATSKTIYKSSGMLTQRGRFYLYSEEYVRANWNCR